MFVSKKAALCTSQTALCTIISPNVCCYVIISKKHWRRPMHRLACQITAYSANRNWIDNDERAICCYAFERRLLLMVFLLVQVLIYAPTGKLTEAFIYITVALSFRRRIGGIHANSAWLCQVISTASVLTSVFVLGPLVVKLPPKAIYACDALLILSMFLIKPFYPVQVHFSQHDIEGNIRRKNVLVILLIIAQALTAKWLGMLFITYSLLGLFFVIFTVLIGKICEREG